MRRFFLGVVVLVAVATVARSQEKADGVEPPLEFHIEVDGKKLPVKIDEPFDLEGGAAKKAILRVGPTRLLVRGPVRFRYPREFVFEHDGDSPAVTVWTVSGNDAKVMLFRYMIPVEPKEALGSTVDGMAERFGKKTKVEATKLNLGGKELEGKRVEATIGGALFRQDVVGFSAGGKTWLLLVQDSPREGKSTPEAVKALDLLKETWKAE